METDSVGLVGPAVLTNSIIARQAAREIVCSTQGLDEKQAERFFAWLARRAGQIPPCGCCQKPRLESFLCGWLGVHASSVPALFLEYTLIMGEVEHFCLNEQE
ncbi:MAG: hypothetical protein HYR70_04295 [Chloroflexi bacterium]|nr:hypothetical protein [Chloroflexota bacterium]MBI3340777.1 hypothetical protein [Chloroflexota bacterium]